MEWTNELFWFYRKDNLIFSAIFLKSLETSWSGSEWVKGWPLSAELLKSWCIGKWPRNSLLNSLAVFSTPPSPNIGYFSKIKITLNLLIVLCFTEIYFKEQLSPHSSIGRAIDL